MISKLETLGGIENMPKISLPYRDQDRCLDHRENLIISPKYKILQIVETGVFTVSVLFPSQNCTHLST